MIAEILLKIRHFYFSLRGIHFHPESVISGVPIRSFRLVGKYSNIYLGKNAEIRSGCYLIARDKIIIGENSTLAYGTTILTTADPNGPYNALAILYPYKFSLTDRSPMIPSAFLSSGNSPIPRFMASIGALIFTSFPATFSSPV